MCVISRALRVMEREFKEPGEKLNCSELSKNYCRLQLGAEKEEVFGVIFLDAQNRMIAFEKMFRGTINESPVFARPIVRKIMEHNAAKVILCHNHPSGVSVPSKSDIDTTLYLKKAFDYIDCKVVDHIIVTAKEARSLAEEAFI